LRLAQGESDEPDTSFDATLLDKWRWFAAQIAERAGIQAPLAIVAEEEVAFRRDSVSPFAFRFPRTHECVILIALV
jgi:hypothetical protein